MILYLSGYLGQFQTLATIRARWTVRALHPEFRRRVVRMMVHAKRLGIDIGIGEGARLSSAQRAEFLRRHYVDPSGPIPFEGLRWSRHSWAAPLAPPGSSNHEDDTTPKGAVAADLVGALEWAMANCHLFGLMHFLRINGEGWHYQVIEQAAARRDRREPWPRANERWRPVGRKALHHFPPLPPRSSAAARSWAAARAARPAERVECTS